MWVSTRENERVKEKETLSVSLQVEKREKNNELHTLHKRASKARKTQVNKEADLRIYESAN